MRIAICDPNFNFLNSVRNEIENLGRKISVFCYPNIEKLTNALDEGFDALIINTEIGAESGIESALNVKKQCPDTEILYVTQHGEKYAQMIFYNVDVIRPYAYFIKPISRIYFQKIIQCLDEYIFEKQIGDLIIHSSDGEISSVSIANIIYIEHNNRITSIFDKKGKCYMCRRTITQFENHLPERLFCHISKSCIVNLSEVEQLSGNNVLMKNGDQLFASRNYKSDFKNAFENYNQRTKNNERLLVLM